jgi:predicted RNA-binding protein YlxR (DUF448 family)
VTERAEPVRTCVGCRVRTAKSDLLRVVAVDGSVIPDPSGAAPGRGAHLHPDHECLAAAERRRAFGKALRLTGPVDLAPVRRWVTEHPATAHTGGPDRSKAEPHDERSMSQHR